MLTLLPLLILVCGGGLALVVGAVRDRGMPLLASVSSLGAGIGGLLAWHTGAARVTLPWASTWGARLSLHADGLATLFILLTCGVGAAVLMYSGIYLKEGRRRRLRFFAWMLAFQFSMVLLSLAQDLLLMFVAFDLTTICSYELIGHERTDRKSRSAAFTALVVTGVTSAMFLAGTVILAAQAGTFDVEEVLGRLEPGLAVALATALIVIAALAKSAQVPFHFWLLRAMVAPTPVSAYLHSAAMVAAGVFLLARLHPLLAATAGSEAALQIIGVSTIAIGGTLALLVDDLKKILAYSTVAQYGFMVLLLSLNAHVGAVAFGFYVLTHAIAKSALFLTVGTVTGSTGAESLSELRRTGERPAGLSVASGLAAATLAGLPLTMGFFKDESLFAGALEGPGWMPFIVVCGTALTFAYSARLWTGMFLGPSEPRGVPLGSVAPIVVLASISVIGGVSVLPFERISEAAGSTIARVPVSKELTYHFDLRVENVMALATYGLGALLLVGRRSLEGIRLRVEWLERKPGAWFGGALAGLSRVSTILHSFELRDLRDRLAAIVVPAGLFVGLALVTTWGEHRYEIGSFRIEHLKVYLLLAVFVCTAIVAAGTPHHTNLVIATSAGGYIVAGFFALNGAPDVALVSVLVGTALTLVWLAILPRLPHRPPPGEEKLRARLQPIVGAVTAAFAFVLVWTTLSSRSDPSVSESLISRTKESSSGDAVTAILADFRALDTLGEATVLAVAVLGISALRRRRKEDP